MYMLLAHINMLIYNMKSMPLCSIKIEDTDTITSTEHL